MIARIWRGSTDANQADRYLNYLQATGIPEYRATPGNQGAWVLRRVVDGRTEFITLTFGDSLDAIRCFAGDDHERAVYYPEDAAFLLELLPTVEHYELHPTE